MTLVEQIAEAIHAATHVSHTWQFGSYDYSSYPGEKPPYVVKAPGQREVVFRSNDHAEAKAFWEKAEKERLAQATLDAISAAGMVVVPREPTEEMKEAGIEDHHGHTGFAAMLHAYRAMIAAAPLVKQG